MGQINAIALEYEDLADDDLWVRQLRAVSDADHLNPVLSGYACAMLLERNLISDENLAREVSRRLSPGIDADLGAGWFEGLSRRNRYALLSRISLWQQLSDYVGQLDETQFRRALVFLRRAFGAFTPREKHRIAEILGQIWGMAEESVSEMMTREFTQDELESLTDLNTFDFSDF